MFSNVYELPFLWSLILHFILFNSSTSSLSRCQPFVPFFFLLVIISNSAIPVVCVSLHGISPRARARADVLQASSSREARNIDKNNVDSFFVPSPCLDLARV